MARSQRFGTKHMPLVSTLQWADSRTRAGEGTLGGEEVARYDGMLGGGKEGIWGARRKKERVFERKLEQERAREGEREQVRANRKGSSRSCGHYLLQAEGGTFPAETDFHGAGAGARTELTLQGPRVRILAPTPSSGAATPCCPAGAQVARLVRPGLGGVSRFWEKIGDKSREREGLVRGSRLPSSFPTSRTPSRLSHRGLRGTFWGSGVRAAVEPALPAERSESRP